MRRIIIAFLILISVLVMGVVAYIAVKYKSTSSMMTEASSLVASGAGMQARGILLKVLNRDPSNEEALVMLANIAEKASLPDTASMRWQQASDLNPLNVEYFQKMFSVLTNSHSDNSILRKYREFENSPKMTDEIRFLAAMASLRLDDSEKAAKIIDKLKKSKTAYSKIIDAYAVLARVNYRVALRKFSDILKNKLTPLEMDYVNLGMAYCYVGMFDVESAKKRIKAIVGKSAGINSEVDILMSHIALIERQPKNALAHYMKACDVQRTNIPVILDAAELALSLSDASSIEKLRKLIPTLNKSALMFDYYLEALYKAAKNESAEAREALELSGDLKKRNAARILAFKLACDVSDISELPTLAKELPAELPQNLKDAFASELIRIVLKHKGDTASVEKLCAAIMSIRPETEYAQRVMLALEIRQKNYAGALEISDMILKTNPDDRMAFEARTIALANLSRSTEGFNFVKAKADTGDAFSIMYAAKFAADSEQPAEAFPYILAAAKLSIPADVALEFGRFAISHGTSKDFDAYISEIKKRGGKNERGVESILMAEFSRKHNDLKSARKYYEETIKVLPKFELPYIALAIMDYLDADKLSAQKHLERGLKEVPDSAVLKLRLASLLVESGKPEDIQEAFLLIDSMPPDMKKSAFTQAALSQIYSLQKKPMQALAAANNAYALLPSNPEVLYQLSSRLLEQKRAQEAFDFAMRALKMTKDARILELSDKALAMVSESALSSYTKKNNAEVVLRFNPKSEVAKKIRRQAIKEIEESR